jgi:hypothetical protein
VLTGHNVFYYFMLLWAQGIESEKVFDYSVEHELINA